MSEPDDDFHTPQRTRTQRLQTPGAPARPRLAPLAVGAAAEPMMMFEYSPKLDVVFTIDKTGSMAAILNSMKTNFRKVFHHLVEYEDYDVRFGLVVYQDWAQEGTDEDGSNVVDSWRFTWDVAEFEENLAPIVAGGGGDGPEAVECGLKRTLHMDWREDATKLCLLIGDAPPHGLGEKNDAFKTGAPGEDTDVFAILEDMASANIRIYGIGCEPTLSDLYLHGSDFFVAAAEKTKGGTVALKASSTLAEVVIGCAVEQVDLDDVYRNVKHEAQILHERDPRLPAREVLQQVFQSLEGKGFTTVRFMEVSALEKTPTAMKLTQCQTLDEARALLGLEAAEELRPEPNGGSRGGDGTYSVYCGMSGCTLDASDDELEMDCVAPKPEAKAPVPFHIKIEEDQLSSEYFEKIYRAQLGKEKFWSFVE